VIDLAFPAPQLAKLRAQLAHCNLESAAILLAVPVPRGENGPRLLVKAMAIPTEADYLTRTATEVELKPEFALLFEKTAARQGWSLVYVHTHPAQENEPSFSPIDDRAEARLASYARMRSPQALHVALLLGKERLIARELGASNPVRVLEVGDRIEHAYDPVAGDVDLEVAHDRQIRAFGEAGQRRLKRLRVVIVGLGGTGSVVAQQLAHLGINDFLLIDPQLVDGTNLNRVIGATHDDVDKTLKVDVAARVIQTIRPGARITKIAQDVLAPGVGLQVAASDFVFCCTDSHGSRHLLNQIAYQYLMPTIDMGVSITPDAALANLQLWAHIRLLAPGQACLHCTSSLDADQVRRDLMTEPERRRDPYFNKGVQVTQPAVIPLTSMAASVATTMFLSAVVGIPAPARHLTLQVHRGRMAPMDNVPHPTCPYCREEAIAVGGGIALPERDDA
jgi:hypothetical protein